MIIELLKKYIKCGRDVCSACKKLHPEWESELNTYLEEKYPIWKNNEIHDYLGTVVWKEFIYLWSLRAVDCVIIGYDDPMLSLCHYHLLELGAELQNYTWSKE